MEREKTKPRRDDSMQYTDYSLVVLGAAQNRVDGTCRSAAVSLSFCFFFVSPKLHSCLSKDCIYYRVLHDTFYTDNN